jgi:anti-anti-sigma regulatory factor
MALESIPHCCPVCDGQLYVASSVPRCGAECPFCRTPLWFLRRACAGVVVLTFLPERHKDASNIPSIDAVSAALRNATQVVVNLTHVRSVNRPFLEMLTTLQKQLQSVDGSLKVCVVHGKVLEAFRDAKLDAGLEIHADEQAALNSFGCNSGRSVAALPCLFVQSSLDEWDAFQSPLAAKELS